MQPKMDEKKLINQLVEALDLEEFTEGYRRRLLILDSQIEAFRKLEQTYRDKLTDLDEMLVKFGAVCQVCSRLNILCTNVGKTNSKEPPHEQEKGISEKLSNWY